MMTKIRGFLKFVVALAIPAGMVYFWIYSNEQARIEVEKYQKEQKENPNVDRITVDNYELKEVDDANRIRWQLIAHKGTMIPQSKDVELDSVKVEYFDGDTNQLKMRISAPTGLANEATRKVRLDAAKGVRVVAEGEQGKGRMETQKLELTKKNQFVATGGVNIVWPGVAKVSGKTAEGAVGKGGLQDLKIAGGTHALIDM